MLKMTVGMGSIDDYIDYVKAGADEVFCGYVTDAMLEKYGMLPAVNRREVYYYPVQIGGRNELEILAQMVQVYHVPVTITLNNIFYHRKQYDLLDELVQDCLDCGFDHFIVADDVLLERLQNKPVAVHLSGEHGEFNAYTLDALPKVSRVIFPRSMDWRYACDVMDDKHQYEAFLLNEKCHFFGAYCQSLHCDEMRHLCLVDYAGKKEKNMNDEVIGSGGCGLCALWRLAHLGIQYFKIVGRGEDREAMLADIQAVKKAFMIEEAAASEAEYIQMMKEALFPEGCSHNCYYVRPFPGK